MLSQTHRILDRAQQTDKLFLGRCSSLRCPSGHARRNTRVSATCSQQMLGTRAGCEASAFASGKLAGTCQKSRRSRSTQCHSLQSAWLELSQQTLKRDIVAGIFTFIPGLILMKVFKSLQQAGVFSQKVSRKVNHIIAGVGFLLCWPLYSHAPYARYFAALAPAANIFRMILVGTGAVDDEGFVDSISRSGNRAEVLQGPLYYCLILLAATIVYWRESPVGITAVALMSGGDGLADLFGRKFGHEKLPWNREKSWAGSSAMFLGGWGLSVAFIALYQWLGYFECTLAAVAGSLGALSLVATLTESLAVNNYIDDNLSVPIVTALLGQFLFARGVIFLA